MAAIVVGVAGVLKKFKSRITGIRRLVTAGSTPPPKCRTMPIRVLFQPTFFIPERWNGVDEHLLFLSRHLDRREFELLLCVAESDGPQTLALAREGELGKVWVEPSPRSAARRFRAWQHLYQRVKPDVVHLHTPTVGGQTLAAAAARLSGAAAMMTVHQFQPWAMPRRTRLLNRLSQAAFSSTVAVSEDVRQSLAERAGLSASGVKVVANGIDSPSTSQCSLPPLGEDGCVRIGFFGRLSREKGVDRLLQALSFVQARGLRFHLYVAGDGPEGPALRALSAALGLEASVTFLGFVSGPAGLMKEVDVVAHTPLYEGFGLVILEAMALERPVVVCPAPGGIREMVAHGETGLISADASAEAIAAALERLILDPVERKRMGAAARQRWLRDYTADRMAAKTAELYRRASNERPPAMAAATSP